MAKVDHYKLLKSALAAVPELKERDAHKFLLHMGDILDSCRNLEREIRKFAKAKPTLDDLEDLEIAFIFQLAHINDHWRELRPLLEKRNGFTERSISIRTMPKTKAKAKQKR